MTPLQISDVVEFLRTGEVAGIRIGQTRGEVHARLGEPTSQGGPGIGRRLERFDWLQLYYEDGITVAGIQLDQPALGTTHPTNVMPLMTLASWLDPAGVVLKPHAALTFEGSQDAFLTDAGVIVIVAADLTVEDISYFPKSKFVQRDQTRLYRCSCLLTSPQINRLLAERPAVIMECIAQGAGARYWYYCRSLKELESICPVLSPGSRVEFYFDDRFYVGPYRTDHEAAILSIVERDGDCVVGVLDASCHEFKATLVDSTEEVAEIRNALAADALVFWGAYPSPEDNPSWAVTIKLPDADGEVRKHAY